LNSLDSKEIEEIENVEEIKETQEISEVQEIKETQEISETPKQIIEETIEKELIQEAKETQEASELLEMSESQETSENETQFVQDISQPTEIIDQEENVDKIAGLDSTEQITGNVEKEEIIEEIGDIKREEEKKELPLKGDVIEEISDVVESGENIIQEEISLVEPKAVDISNEKENLEIKKEIQQEEKKIEDKKIIKLNNQENLMGGFLSDMTSFIFKGAVSKSDNIFKVKNISLDEDIVFDVLGKKPFLKLGNKEYSLVFSPKGYDYIVPYFLYSILILGNNRRKYKFSFEDAKEISEIHKNVTKALGFKNQNNYSIDASNIKSFIKGIKTLLDNENSKYTIAYNEEKGGYFELVKR
ncbi:MAG: hypothetical protein PHF46_05015, partial [Candidatus Gracilibacteria bacterium]|nr:hypothetical protein [Candidatus Gracilibacteria bacterium]